MTRKHWDLLGRVFMAEVKNRLPFQTKSKLINDLHLQGHVCTDEVAMSGLLIRGWRLSHRGRYVYCDWASKQKGLEL